MFYVAMTDTFMSGWGKAEGKINKLVFECGSKEEVDIVVCNAKSRSEMEDIKVLESMPSYDDSKVYLSFKTKDDYSSWYKADYFSSK